MYKDVIITVDNPRLEIANTHDMYIYIIRGVQAIFNGGAADDPDLKPGQACFQV